MKNTQPNNERGFNLSKAQSEMKSRWDNGDRAYSIKVAGPRERIRTLVPHRKRGKSADKLKRSQLLIAKQIKRRLEREEQMRESKRVENSKEYKDMMNSLGA